MGHRHQWAGNESERSRCGAQWDKPVVVGQLRRESEAGKSRENA